MSSGVFWVFFELIPVYFPQRSFILQLSQDSILSDHQMASTWKYSLYQKMETCKLHVTQNDTDPSIMLCHLIPT